MVCRSQQTTWKYNPEWFCKYSDEENSCWQLATWAEQTAPPAADFGRIKLAVAFLCPWHSLADLGWCCESTGGQEAWGCQEHRGRQAAALLIPSLPWHHEIDSAGLPHAPSPLSLTSGPVFSYCNFGFLPCESLQFKDNIIFIFGSYPTPITDYTRIWNLWIL